MALKDNSVHRLTAREESKLVGIMRDGRELVRAQYYRQRVEGDYCPFVEPAGELSAKCLLLSQRCLLTEDPPRSQSIGYRNCGAYQLAMVAISSRRTE